MTVLFSRKCEYALQALLYLGSTGSDVMISTERLSTELGISREFVSKTLQGLVKDGLLTSSRGKSGGFSLDRPAETITLLEIVELIDGPAVFESCILGLPECGSENPCVIHEAWGALREQARETLAGTTLASFTR